MQHNAIQPQPDLSLLPQLPRTRSRSVARWVSHIASPPLLAAGSTVMTAAQLTGNAAWLWALFSIGFTILLPTLCIVWMMRNGKVTDFDIYVREQRFWPYLIGIACALVTWLVMFMAGAPNLFLVITGAVAGQSIMLFLVNLRWKISVHATGTACFAVLSWQLFGLWGATLFLAIPLVAWSRVLLGRHTTGQVIAGASLGAALLFAALKLWA